MSNWSFFRSPHNEILFALWLKTTLQNGFVVIIQVLWVISRPDVKLNLLSQGTHMNPVRSLIQNCSAKWLLWWYFMSCHFKSRCLIELLVTGHTHESCLLSDLKLLCKMTFVVILHFLQFQVQMSNWTSCHRAHTWILFALWFESHSTAQNERNGLPNSFQPSLEWCWESKFAVSVGNAKQLCYILVLYIISF